MIDVKTHLQGKAHAVLDGAAVLVRALVHARLRRNTPVLRICLWDDETGTVSHAHACKHSSSPYSAQPVTEATCCIAS